jgi:hypothetical protein
MPHSRLSFDEALTLWEARAVYRVSALCRTLLILFFVLECAMEATHGYWYVGVVLVAVQYALVRGLLWLLRWVLRWANRGVYWCVDHTTAALATWWQAHWRSQ